MVHQVHVTTTTIIYCNVIITIECVIAGYRNCKEWLEHGYSESGIYPVNPDKGKPFQV